MDTNSTPDVLIRILADKAEEVAARMADTSVAEMERAARHAEPPATSWARCAARWPRAAPG
ncbi:hypothetical protein [Roseococcus microcysteis]